MDNPFMEDTNELLALDTKNVTQPCAAEVVSDHIDNGKVRFTDFIKSLQVGEC